MRRALIGLLAAAALVAGCGGSDAPQRASATASAPGRLTPTTPDGRSNEAAASDATQLTSATGERTDVRRQRPCSLVSTARAKAIFGRAVRKPVEAAQGPTCIYRTRGGNALVTVSVQSQDFRALSRKLAQSSKLRIADRTAYCGTYGQPMLYADVAGGYVLSVAGSCELAKQFASAALPKLTG